MVTLKGAKTIDRKDGGIYKVEAKVTKKNMPNRSTENEIQNEHATSEKKQTTAIEKSESDSIVRLKRIINFINSSESSSKKIKILANN